ncbi:hypothetical protein, partial, partial [Parasitella parasitica]
MDKIGTINAIENILIRQNVKMRIENGRGFFTFVRANGDRYSSVRGIECDDLDYLMEVEYEQHHQEQQNQLLLQLVDQVGQEAQLAIDNEEVVEEGLSVSYEHRQQHQQQHHQEQQLAQEYQQQQRPQKVLKSNLEDEMRKRVEAIMHSGEEKFVEKTRQLLMQSD